jgi:hypothetical protein
VVFSVVQNPVGADVEVSAEQLVEITLFSREVSQFVADALETDSTITYAFRSFNLGRITDIEIGESIRFLRDAQGNEVPSSNPGFVSVTVRTQLAARLSDGALVVGSYLYPVGTSIHIWIGDATFSVRITSIQTEVSHDN